MKMFEKSGSQNLSPGEKMVKDIGIKVIKNLAITTFDIAGIIANPVIVISAAKEIDDEFGKIALSGIGKILAVYQIRSILSDIKATKLSITAYNAALELQKTEACYIPDEYPSTIDLPASEWNIQPEDIIINESENADNEVSASDEYVEGGFEYIIHIGDDIPYDDGEDD